MSTVSAADVRSFVVSQIADGLEAIALDPASVPDELDLLAEGLIDSFGILKLISDLEERFAISIDFDALPARDLTRVGPFSRYVETMAVPAAANDHLRP